MLEQQQKKDSEKVRHPSKNNTHDYNDDKTVVRSRNAVYHYLRRNRGAVRICNLGITVTSISFDFSEAPRTQVSVSGVMQNIPLHHQHTHRNPLCYEFPIVAEYG